MCSSDSEDDLISYGTPLEPLEEDEVPNKKPQLLEDQVVKDKQGRRRFHGAFTGGFSAGFFNTVGSCEGWTPSSFKSSKTKKQDIYQQKPEDFMDEEDLSEFGIAPVVLKAKQNYTVQSKKNLLAFNNFSTLGNYVLQDLLKPVRETIGIQLLKKMGWKPGQGVGPRLLKKEKENILKMRQKIYGCQLPSGPLKETEETDPNSNSEWEEFEFAPNDCEPFIFEDKNDSSGLGYEGLNKRSVLSGNFSKKENESMREKNKKFKFSSQAFGVGAFEEEDEDIYAKDDMSSYDFVLGSELFSNSKKLTDKNSFGVIGVLEGFVLEAKKHPKKHYSLPKLPRDFTPHHKVHHSGFNHLVMKDKEAKSKRNQKVNLEDKKEVFKEQSNDLPKGKKQTEELISNLTINENKFKPFSSNPEKQKRYENYLKLIKIGKKELLSNLQPLSMTDWDKEREATEFEKAALLFSPLTGEMGDRFLVAKQSDDLDDPLAVVENYLGESDDRMKAAKINMFGPVTRKTEEWLPSSLLCKRFNVPEPKGCNVPSSGKKVEKCFFSLFSNAQNGKENSDKNCEIGNFKNSPLGESSKSESETNELKNENLEENPDKSDLFKAIFLSSDEDEEKKVEGVTETVKLIKKQRLEEKSLQTDVLYDDELINSKRNLSPPSGIFKNIDLDLLSNSKRSAEASLKSGEVETSGTGSLNLVSDPTLSVIYGPKIPEKVQVKTEFSSTKGFKDINVWVEKKIHSKKKHKKKDKKSKKARYKSKHKHKKH